MRESRCHSLLFEVEKSGYHGTKLVPHATYYNDFTIHGYYQITQCLVVKSLKEDDYGKHDSQWHDDKIENQYAAIFLKYMARAMFLTCYSGYMYSIKKWEEIIPFWGTVSVKGLLVDPRKFGDEDAEVKDIPTVEQLLESLGLGLSLEEKECVNEEHVLILSKGVQLLTLFCWTIYVLN